MSIKSKGSIGSLMRMNKILDKTIDSTNYAGFKKCLILNNGNKVRFVFACGVSYDVPFEYVLQWVANPHYILKNGRMIEWDKTKSDFDKESVKALKCRRVLDKLAIRFYLDNNTAFDISWDTVLMACEPNYEHFGGLTVESKDIVKKWHKKRGVEISKQEL